MISLLLALITTPYFYGRTMRIGENGAIINYIKDIGSFVYLQLEDGQKFWLKSDSLFNIATLARNADSLAHYSCWYYVDTTRFYDSLINCLHGNKPDTFTVLSGESLSVANRLYPPQVGLGDDNADDSAAGFIINVGNFSNMILSANTGLDLNSEFRLTSRWWTNAGFMSGGPSGSWAYVPIFKINTGYGAGQSYLWFYNGLADTVGWNGTGIEDMGNQIYFWSIGGNRELAITASGIEITKIKNTTTACVIDSFKRNATQDTLFFFVGGEKYAAKKP